MNARHHKLLVLAGLSALALGWAVGCDNSNEDASAAKATASPASTTPASATANQGMATPPAPSDTSTTGTNDDHYELRSPSQPVAVGQKAKVELEVVAADGLHVNEEFPWSFEFSQPAGIKIAQTKIAKNQIKFDQGEAKIPMYVQASQPGKHSLHGSANFSVCNDTQCYVIRNKKVAFTIEATPAKIDPGAAPAQ